MEIRNQVAIESRSNGIGNFILNEQKLNEGLSLLAKACAKKAARLGYLDEGILLESSTLKGNHPKRTGSTPPEISGGAHNDRGPGSPEISLRLYIRVLRLS